MKTEGSRLQGQSQSTFSLVPDLSYLIVACRSDCSISLYVISVELYSIGHQFLEKKKKYYHPYVYKLFLGCLCLGQIGEMIYIHTDQ